MKIDVRAGRILPFQSLRASLKKPQSGRGAAW
jgi:hypothetical protein